MKLNYGLHLAYCTNVHRGETWQQTFDSLQQYTLAVRDQVCPKGPYAIGLRLSEQAARELSDFQTLRNFRRWLDKNHCYVFTINGFPFGKFHGGAVKEKVYTPDWTSPMRLEYTNRLFDLLSQLLPPDIEGSVSTVPGSFKEFVKGPDYLKAIRTNIWHCVEHVARVSEQTGRRMHLGLEPEPLCLLETTTETVHFFDRLRAEHPRDHRAYDHLGVNYDTCHLAVEFEEPAAAIQNLQQHQIRISKLHLSSALKTNPNPEVCAMLQAFADEIYLHQVVARDQAGQFIRFKDLPDALSAWEKSHNASAVDAEIPAASSEEWRIHFHLPLHSPEIELFGDTRDHLLGVFDILAQNPALCSHLEMETYTWEVLPQELKNRTVVEQLVGEYEWCLAQLAERGLANKV